MFSLPLTEVLHHQRIAPFRIFENERHSTAGCPRCYVSYLLLKHAPHGRHDVHPNINIGIFGYGHSDPSESTIKEEIRQRGKMFPRLRLLATIYGWFAEGFDTLDFKQAKALVAELA
jgi:hypothetical protein